MKKLPLLSYLCLLLSLCGIAQRQNDNWTFGKNAGLTFNGSPSGFSFFTSSQMVAPKGCASISDRTTGQLLFYTDGRTVWNKNNVMMANGNDLLGCPQAAQPAIIVPKPGTSKEYYIFTISGINLNQTGVPERKGLAYSVVDMTLNGGLGGVTATKNVSLFTNSDTEMLTSTLTNDGTGYWVVTQKETNFQAYKVTSTGINTTPVLSTAITSAIGVSATRGLKFSPNGQKLAARYLYDFSAGSPGLIVYNFNNTTGAVSTSRHLTDYAWQYTEDVPANGVEFSPDGRYLYAGIRIACLCMGYSYQDQISVYDLNDPSADLYWMTYISLPAYSLANLQLGKDNKIYCQLAYSTGSLNNKMMVISNPGMTGGNSFSTTDYTLPNPTKVGQRFPQLVSLTTVPICEVNLNINLPVETSQDFQVSNVITASAPIYNNLTVNYKALQVVLKPGFSVRGITTGNFRAYVSPCGGGVARPGDGQDDYIDSMGFVEEEKPTAVKEKVIKISPNPNDGLFSATLSGLSEGTVEISDMTGFTIYRSSFKNQSELPIDIRHMGRGIYIVRITSGDQVYLEKIIKK